jgi:hypothetical protein
MARIAGDSPHYEFRLCRITKSGIAKPTSYGFGLVSVSTFIGEVMGKPAGAMSWWGYRIGLDGVVEALIDGESIDDLDREALEELLKQRGVSPNMRRDEAGKRGNNAHQILEWLAQGYNAEEPPQSVQTWNSNNDEVAFRTIAEAYAEDEERTEGTRYGFAVIDWWDTQIQPFIDNGLIGAVRAEVPVWSLLLGYAGQFDLAVLWVPPEFDHPPGLYAEQYADGWEIVDLKTHKPAEGFTKPGKGAGYVSEAAQILAYRMAWEEMGLGKTIGQRTLVARDKTYRGACWVEDFREVDEAFVINLRQAYDGKTNFERGEA